MALRRKLADRMRSVVGSTARAELAEDPDLDGQKVPRRKEGVTYRLTPDQADENGLGFITGLKDKSLYEEMLIARISSLHLRGHTSAMIVEQLRRHGQDLTIGQVGAYLRISKERWATAALMDIDKAVAQTLAEIEELKAEFWQGYAESKGRTMMVRGVEIVNDAGDPAFLEGVMKCIERRCKLLGLDSPIKIDISAQVRALAEAAGLDPEEAVAEAHLVLQEMKGGASTRAPAAA
jgi:hypothetical protein